MKYVQVMTSTIVTTTARPATVTTDTMTTIATRGTETGTDTTRTGQWAQYKVMIKVWERIIILFFRYREDRYREDRYRESDRYERPPRDYYERERGYERGYDRYGGGGGHSSHYPSSSSRRSASPGAPPSHRRPDY